MRRRRILGLALVLALFAVADCESGPSFEAKGQVVNAAGVGLGAVAVVLQARRGSGPFFDVDASFTDAQGHFDSGVFHYSADLPVDLQLVFTRDGFAPVTLPMATLADKDITRDGLAITLEAAP